MTEFTAASIKRWRKQPVRFIEEVMIDPETEQPFELLPAERTFLEHAFKLNDKGRLLYPEQVYAAPKKSGKTAFAAMHALTTVLLFGGKYANGTLAANDQEQAQGRVFQAARRICEVSPLLKTEARITQDRISFPDINDTSIAAIPTNYASAAGGDQSISVFDELWAYTSERGRRLWDELVPPPTRKIACRLTVTYAGFVGESVLLEELYKRGLVLPKIGKDLYAGDGLLMFWTHEPVAPWQDEAWLALSRKQLRPSAYLRLIENKFVDSESAFIEMPWWDACVDPHAKPITQDRRLQVCVAIDASVKHDSTAIVACTFDKKRQAVRLVNHKIFQPSPDEPLDFEGTIERTILDFKKRYNVRKVLYDPYQMASVAQRLRRAGVRMEEYPQSVPNLTATSQNLYEHIKEGTLIAYPDAEIRLAVNRAVAKETPRGWRIGKDKATHKIDVVVAMAMSALAAVQNQSSYDKSLSWVDDAYQKEDDSNDNRAPYLERMAAFHQRRPWV